MRTASMVLGIVGGCIALIIALFVIFGGIVFVTFIPNFEYSEFYSEFESDNDFHDDFNFNEEMQESSRFGGMIFLIMGSVFFVCGVLGIIGGILVKKKNILSGIFMIISAAVFFFTFWGIIAAILLLLGGIFALVNERNDIPVQQPIQK